VEILLHAEPVEAQKDWNEKPDRRQRPNKITLSLFREITKKIGTKKLAKGNAK
jgi:hypothetical protein